MVSSSPTENKIDVANTGLLSSRPRAPFNAAITGMPKPASNIILAYIDVLFIAYFGFHMNSIRVPLGS